MQTIDVIEKETPEGLSENDIAQLAKDYGRKVYRFILRKVRNPADAEDIYQSTLCEALRVRRSFMWQSKPETWLCGIAFNLVRNFFSRSETMRFAFESDEVLDDLPAEGNDPAEILARNQATRAIEQHLAAIPVEMRKTLTLIAEHNHSYEEAAQVLGVPIGTVRSRVFRAREHLKKTGGRDLLLN